MRTIADPTRTPTCLRVARSVLLVLAFALPFVLMTGKSVTSDETVHIPAGYSYLRTGSVILNPMHPPLIKELCALPLVFMNLPMPASAVTIRAMREDIRYQWKFGEDFFSGADVERVLFWSRLPAVLLSFGLAVIVLRWSTELWGAAGGILSLVCYVFDPTIVAHAELVTTDVGFAFFGTLFIYLLWAYLQAPSRRRAVYAGIGLGLALASKFTAVVLLPVAFVLIVTWAWRRAPFGRDEPRTGVFRSVLAAEALPLFVMAALACAIVWATYLFPSDPLFYWHGIESLYGDKNPRYFYFFLGEFGRVTWPSYFLVAWLVKTPLPSLLLIGAAIIVFAFGRRRRWLDESALIVPPLAIFAAVSVSAHPIGVRYLIPCFPFLYVFAGRLAANLKPRLAPLLALVAAWQIAEFASIWPDHLSYFNQIAGGWRGGTAWLDDSNVDWGQGFVELRDYLARHPRKNVRLCNFVTPINASLYGLDVSLIDSDDALPPPPPGTSILSAHCVARVRARLRSVYGDRPEDWIAHREPSAIVGHVYYVYDFPD